jgi:hypothetical protein
VTAARRTVRATPRFFEDLDRQLPTERGPNGEPSTNDFQVLDLLRIVERFAVEWDDLPELIPDRLSTAFSSRRAKSSPVPRSNHARDYPRQLRDRSDTIR